MIRLLIVDDSALMRRQLSAMFQDEGDFEIRLARNGREAIEENIAFQPDVVTLDINMPEMDGLTALSHLMVQRPVPVVMLSSLTEKGALATFEALNLGAVDYLPKPDGTISLSIDTIRATAVGKVRAAARARPKGARAARTSRAVAAKPVEPKAVALSPTASMPTNSRVVVIGVSTGGPRTLEMILPRLPADFPYPVLVAQHMPASFTGPFSQRLDQVCALNVVEANRPMTLERGKVYVGRGGADMQVVSRAGRPTVLAKPENAQYLWHPSVELLGRSVLEVFRPADILAVMLTGMGHDGADAFAEVRRRGGSTIAESQDSCVVFGMPNELIKRGGAQHVLAADEIGERICAWARK